MIKKYQSAGLDVINGVTWLDKWVCFNFYHTTNSR